MEGCLGSVPLVTWTRYVVERQLVLLHSIVPYAIARETLAPGAKLGRGKLGRRGSPLSAGKGKLS